MRKTSILLFLTIITSTASFAQSNTWKRMRYEFFGGIGATNFLGELGGADEKGSTFIQDLEITETHFGANLGARYWFSQKMAVQSAFSFGFVRGDDAKTEEEFRKNRNLSFRSPIFEWQFRLEYNLFPQKKGHRYNLRKVRGRPGNNITIDAFAGIAGFWFNPQAERDGEWIDLQPLGTEGQNYISTREPYSRVAVAIPFGFMVKYIINRKWSASLEFGPRFTFTDYIDDCSGTYADPDKIAESAPGGLAGSGWLAKELADRSLSRETEPNRSAAGEQRGNSFNDDMYMFMFINVNYKVKTGRNGLPRFN